MKRTVLLLAFFMAGTAFSASLFAGGKPELSITNITGALVEEIRIKETKTGSVMSYYPQLENKTATVIKIKKDTYYDITLVDNEGHLYEVKKRKWVEDFNEVAISHIAGGKVELSITNKTGAVLEEIQIRETETGAVKSYYPQLENKEASVIMVKKNTYYDITLVDNKGHLYGVKKRKWGRDINEVAISHTNYIYQDLGGFFRRIIGR
ncbi:MAG: hypothetical protein LBQ89_02270 [Treponema sp.]|jgi:hypothetical protein|nr:hypothetical protein [Treponema sp.]